MIDGRAHYVEIAEPNQLDGVRRGGIVEVAPPPTGPRTVDRTIGAFARDNFGLYQPREHLIEAKRTIRVPHDDYGGYVEAHVRRLEALRRAGIVERMNANNWIIPEDFELRAADYDAKRSRSLTVRVLSAFDLEAQITSDGATWLDRQILRRDMADPVESGFGREVIDAKRRRVQVLIAQGFAEREDGNRLRVRRDLLATLEQREVTRVGQELAENRNTPFRQAKDGEHVNGTFKETVQLASGKYALIENSREFALVPWRPVIERQLGKLVAAALATPARAGHDPDRHVMKPRDTDRKAARSPTDSSIGNGRTHPDHGLQRRNDRAKRFRQPGMPLPEQFRPPMMMVLMASAAAPALTSSVRAAVKSP